MSARNELNKFHILGSVGLAVAAGAITNSWFAFLLTLVFLIALSLFTGEIRPRGRR